MPIPRATFRAVEGKMEGRDVLEIWEEWSHVRWGAKLFMRVSPKKAHATLRVMEELKSFNEKHRYQHAPLLAELKEGA